MALDLSSLEGPPIHDSRFTVTVQHCPDIPRIHLETPAWTPPRSASSGTPRQGHKPAQTQTQTNWGKRRSLEINNPNPAISPSRTADLLHPGNRWSQPSNLSPGYDDRTRRPRARSQPNQHNNKRLIWLDQENIWIVIERSTTGTEPGTGAGTMTAGSANAPTNIRPALSHSRSAESFLRSCGSPSPYIDGGGGGGGGGGDMEMNTDDSPPPYENHYYDAILTPQPTRHLARQNHCSGQVSPWAAMARRLNRSPV